MVQYGLVRRWNSKYLKNKPVCDLQTEYEGVQFQSLILAFGILFGGCFIGLIFSITERICCLNQSVFGNEKTPIGSYP
jgi:hypothetical protein